MSLSPNEKYPGATEADPNYKDSKFKDNNPSTTNNGSPLKALDRNEQLALQEAMMNASGFDYNGVVDTPQNSQMFNAYKAALSNGANLLSNHNFIIASPDDSQPAPSATPTSYPPGYEIFSGVFANETTGILNLTYIDGRVSFSGGDFYMSVPNTGALENITEFVASVADFDGKPRTRGVSFALVGDEYRVTVGVDALEDAGAALTPLGSVKFEQGSVATGHEVDINVYFGVYGSTDVRSLGIKGDGSDELSALQSVIDGESSITIPDGLNINLGGGTLNLKSDLSIYMTSSSLISNGVINSRIAGLSNLNIPLLNINKVEVDLGGQSSSQPVGDGVVLGIVYGLNSRLILRHLRGGGVSLIKLTNDADKISGAPLAIANTLNSDFGPIKILGDFDFGIEFVGETASEPCAGDCTFESIIAEKTPGTAEVNGHHGIYIKGVSDCYFGYIKATGFSDSNNQRNDIKIRDSQRNKFAKLTCGYLQLTSDANINSQNYTLDNKLKNTTVTGQAQIFSGASGQHGGNEIENFSGKLNGTSCNLNPNYNYTWKLRGDIDTKDGDYQPVDLNLMFSDAIVSGGMLFDGSTNVFDGVKGERVTFNHPIYSINRDIDLKDFYVNGGINMQPTAGTRKITLSHGTVDGRLVTNSFGTRNIEADWSFLDVKSDREPNINDRPNLLSRYRFVSFDDGYSLSGDFTPIP